MLDSRSLRLDLAALVLLAASIFLGIALATYHPADSFDALVWPPAEQAHNSCGRAGAILADLLLRGIGVGAYYLVASLAALDCWLLARRTISDPIVRAIGWAASLVGISTLASMLVSSWSPGPVIGPGGYLG